MIIGVGCDIVAFERISRVLEKHDILFLERIFSPEERAAIETKKNSGPYLAGRWAAKESVAKAFGTGIGASAAFNEISIVNNPSGQPVVTLSGTAENTARALGVERIHLSISHDTDYAVAMAILEGKPAGAE